MICKMNKHTLIKLFHGTIIALVMLLISTSAVAQQKPKISYGILLDSTGSMRSQFETVLAIGRSVVHQTAPSGPVSIFNFASDRGAKEWRAVPVLRIQESQDEAKLNRTIDGLYIEGGQTSLLDAIQFIADRLQEWSPNSEKVIVVVSDGEDRVSKVKSKELIQQLKDRKIKVFAVGLVGELESGKRSKATDLLQTLAKETGGAAVIPKSRDVDVQSLLTELAIPTP
jgi:von Willebrand factor type A domain